MRTRMLVLVAAAAAVAGCLAAMDRSPDGRLSLRQTVLVLPQWDYEPAIYHTDADPYPHLDHEAVDRTRVVQREHTAVVLQNEYVRLTLLPEMGRVYSLVYLPTGNEVFWQNDTVSVGGGQNDTGWWMWIGGAEYTLPGDEHGTTWALPWRWEVAVDTDTSKAVRMQVQEPGTGLLQTLQIGLHAGHAWYRADIGIANPTDSTVHYAHWVNPQWTPGGRNELTDTTEFIIPTERILIEERWQKNLGPSPQPWPGNPLRFIHGWPAMGDLMADSLIAGFYSAYSHEEEEGVVRVFDPVATPGVDIWTYGFRPTRIPMGSGAPNRGYAEMWGGTSRTYPDERKPLAPGGVVRWSEWMYPYHSTGGLTFADRQLAVNFKVRPGGAVVGVCPAGRWAGTVQLLSVDARAGSPGRALRSWDVGLAPDRPLHASIDLNGGLPDPCRQLLLKLEPAGDGAPLVLRPQCEPPTP